GCALWIVTRGAHAIEAGPSRIGVPQSTAWGMCRTIAIEHPEIRCVRVDLGPSPSSDDAEVLLAEVCSSSPEDEVAIRSNSRLVSRLVRKTLAADAGHRSAAEDRMPVGLETSERGVLENLSMRPRLRRPPARWEVEIAVRAAGLNFRDVLNALGMYPGEPGPLGNECVGTIVSVGEGVADLAVGDEVLAIASGTFGSYVTTDRELVARQPANLDASAAATIPI